ncbi:MAG: hypothetical protein LBM93_04615, partial [Oscillospiraceae bacterium]|nr:hypothetical protein [Oscillospiraceae bacterium]
ITFYLNLKLIEVKLELLFYKKNTGQDITEELKHLKEEIAIFTKSDLLYADIKKIIDRYENLTQR